MSRPDLTRQAAMSAAFARAVDLSGLKDRPAAPAGEPISDQPASPYVVDVTEASFGDVLQASAQIPIVVDLWAEWCGPCKQLSPVLERLAVAANGAWILAKVDVDANPRIAQAFNVQSIPMVVAIAGGQPVDAFTGALPEPQVKEWIAALLDALRDKMPAIRAAEEAAGAVAAEPEPEPEDPRLTAAIEATDRGDHEAAAAAYREILAAEPDHPDALAGLAWAELFARVAGGDDAVVAASDAAPGDVELAIAAADWQVVGGEVEAGFGRLVRAVAATTGDERARAREHLLGLFALLPADDDAVVTARRALAAALY